MALRVLVAVVVAALLATAPAAPAAAQSAIGDAAAALRRSDVYVAPGARNVLSATDQRRVQDAIVRDGAGPMYVAVLPQEAADEAGGSTIGVAAQLARQLRRPGVYAVVVGRQLRAGEVGGQLPRGEAGRLARDAIAAHRGEGLGAILVDFARRVGAARAHPGTSGGGGDAGSGVGTGLLVVLAVLLLAGGGLLLAARRRRGREQEAQVADLRAAARDDLVALGDDVREIDIPIEQRDADPRAREALGVALQRYDDAEQRLDRARRPEDFEPITQALEEGRYEMEVAKARLEGREPPQRRPPCFFDPRHGPSVKDVLWAPPGGRPRPVPVCAMDAQRIEQGLPPLTREVEAGGERVPYYQAPQFGPYAGGFFGGFGGGGLLPGLLAGTLLGGALFGPAAAFGAGGWGGWDDGGDPGGGDWGGGDVGGGDWGGGDVGGGDWGGGDIGGGDFGGGGDF
jgi:hypothetical protein